MGHLIDGRDRFEKTPADWLKFGQQVGSICNTWASRSDIVAFVGEGAGQGIAVACWAPQAAEMELNVKQAFGEEIESWMVPDFTERDTHFEFPAVAGATLHEAMHARHTRWPLQAMGDLRMKPDTFSVSHLIEWFEETRIEKRGRRHWPKNRSFLRASALKLSLGDMEEDSEYYKHQSAMSLSKIMLLSLARVDADVLDEKDVAKLQDIFLDRFGEDLLLKLQKIWIKAQAWTKDEDMSGLRRLAEEWVKELEDAGHDTKPIIIKMPPGMPMPGDGDPQPGDGDAEGDAAVAAATEAMEDAAEATEVDAAGEAQHQASAEQDERDSKAAAEAAAEKEDAKEAESKVFGATTAETNKIRTDSKLDHERDPKPEEVRAAVLIAKELEKARYRERWVTKTRAELPPGRMNGRGAMLRDVQRSQGRVATAEPFTTRRRFHTEDPKLTLGIMVDISGSMGGAMEPMGVSAWLMAEAGWRIQARVAAVYYGDSVFPVLEPGRKLDKVKIYRAPDSTERFNLAFKALDGKLDLLNGSGARLLVIVSDMIYTPPEVIALKRWLRRCNEAGVAVMVLPASGRSESVAAHTKDFDVAVIQGARSPVEVAMEIGHRAAQELTKVGTRARE